MAKAPGWLRVKESTPPLDFLPLISCDWAEFSETEPNFIRQVKRRGRRLLGIKYERKAQGHLSSHFGTDYMPSQWLRYKGPDGRIRWCQPDGVYVDRAFKTLTIIEIKYAHTATAWWQLFRLYLPVLERLFDGHGYEFRCVEVCRWYDPAVRTPVPVRLREDITQAKPGEFAVHIWND